MKKLLDDLETLELNSSSKKYNLGKVTLWIKEFLEALAPPDRHVSYNHGQLFCLIQNFFQELSTANQHIRPDLKIVLQQAEFAKCHLEKIKLIFDAHRKEGEALHYISALPQYINQPSTNLNRLTLNSYEIDELVISQFMCTITLPVKSSQKQEIEEQARTEIKLHTPAPLLSSRLLMELESMAGRFKNYCSVLSDNVLQGKDDQQKHNALQNYADENAIDLNNTVLLKRNYEKKAIAKDIVLMFVCRALGHTALIIDDGGAQNPIDATLYGQMACILNHNDEQEFFSEVAAYLKASDEYWDRKKKKIEEKKQSLKSEIEILTELIKERTEDLDERKKRFNKILSSDEAVNRRSGNDESESELNVAVNQKLELLEEKIKSANLRIQLLNNDKRQAEAVLEKYENNPQRLTAELNQLEEKRQQFKYNQKIVSHAKTIYDILKGEVKITRLEFHKTKASLVMILDQYISPLKFSVFGHHHNNRARAVKIAIQKCNTLTQIKDILGSQLILAGNTNGTIKKDACEKTVIKTSAFFQPEFRDGKKNAIKTTGDFYKAIDRCYKAIPSA